MTSATARKARHVVAVLVGITFTGAQFVGCSSGKSSRSSTSSAITNVNGGFVNVGPLATPRVHHTATLLKDGRILIVGGLINQTNATNTTEILDPNTGTVTAGPPMTTPRMHHQAVLLPTGKVLVIGGSPTRYAPALQTTELYDPTTNIWTAGPMMTEGRNRPYVALYDSGKKVLIAGGETWNGTTPVVLSSADIYNADANTIAPTNPMNSARCCGEAITQANGQILLASGYATMSTAQPAPPEVYDIASGLFIPVAMIQNRAEAALIQIGAEIYALGGLDSQSQTLASAELFNGQVWAMATAMTQPRAEHSATVTGTSAVVIGGRLNNATALKSTEFYPASAAPAAGAMPELNEARYDHTATLVGDRVYVIGGFTDGDQILASIEVYAPAGVVVPGAGAGVGTRANGQVPPPPTGSVSIVSLTPNGGNPGDTVRLTGTGFAPLAQNNVVRFNGIQAVVTAVDTTNAAANTMDVIVPVGATTGPVTLQIATTIATGPVFTIGGATSGATPSILLVFPNSAGQFIPVSITGFNFGSNPTVTFNGVPTINILSFSTKNLPLIGSVSELVVLVPPGATSGPLIVHNGTLQSNAVYFQVR